MAWTVGKTELATMVDVLEADYATVQECATAVLSAAEAVLAQRAKYVVVGQLVGTAERQSIAPSDPEAIKVSLGWYSTEGGAIGAADSLWSSSSTGDRFRVWVLPVHHGTPAELHDKQKQKYAEAEAARATKAKEKMQSNIKKRHAAMEERNNGGVGSCATCRHPPYEHRQVGVGKGPCGLVDCSCPKFIERKK